MIRLEEVHEDDFESVYPLLQKLNNTTLSRKDWQKVFSDPFKAKQHSGYSLLDDEKVVGFFGVIFSSRVINGKVVKFANTHSWVVDEVHRNRGLLLLNKIHKLKDYVLTNFSASSGPFEIMKKMGWKELTYTFSFRLVNPIAKITSFEHQIIDGNQISSEFFDPQEEKIVYDHAQLQCTMCIIVSDQQHSLLVFTEVDYAPSFFGRLGIRSKPFTLGQMQFCSNPDLFFRKYDHWESAICKKYGWLGLIIPDKFLERYDLLGFKPYLKRRPVLVRGGDELSDDSVDFLYSEVIVLNLN
jgi:hypothetical protein